MKELEAVKAPSRTRCGAMGRLGSTQSVAGPRQVVPQARKGEDGSDTASDGRNAGKLPPPEVIQNQTPKPRRTAQTARGKWLRAPRVKPLGHRSPNGLHPIGIGAVALAP